MTKSDKAVEIYRKALELEVQGRKFYLKAGAKARDQPGKKLFAMLADDELVHFQRIEKIFNSLNKGEKFSLDVKTMPQKHPEIRQVFAQLALANKDKIKPRASDLDAAEVGLDLENRSINLYAGAIPLASGQLEKEFLEQMVKEETFHHTALSDLKFFLTNPQSWYIEHEKHTLEGV